MKKRYSFKELQSLANQQGLELKKVPYTRPVTYILDGDYMSYRLVVLLLTHK